MPATTEVSEAAGAREKALSPLLAQAEALLLRFDDLPEPHIRVAPDQYGATLSDGRLFKRLRVMLRFPRNLGRFNFDDSAEIGGPIRRETASFIGELEQIYRETEELAWFVPPTPEVPRVRDLLIATGRYGTEIAVTLLRALTSMSLDEVVPLQRRFQELLAGYPYADEFGKAVDTLTAASEPDFDARVAIALGVDVPVTDDLGLLDPARILAAFAGSDDPFTPLAHASAHFLSHLSKFDPEQVRADGAALALPALALATLDRPLPAHRAARQAAELLREADKLDAAQTAVLLERTVNEGPRIFAAAKRIHDDLVYLARGYAPDDADVVRRLIDTYKGLAESVFRSYAWLIDDAHRIVERQPAATATRAPLLGDLEQRFASRNDPLSRTLTRSIDPILRNAQAHEDHRYDRESEDIILEGGERLSVAQFEKRAERLVSVAVALDAAFATAVLERSETMGVPQWLVGGEAPFASELLARGILGAYGIDLVTMSDGETVSFTYAGQPIAPERALPALAAMAQLFARRDYLELRRDGEDAPIIRVETSAFCIFSEADETVKDMALLAPFYSAGVIAGRDEGELLADALALFVALIARIDVPRIQLGLAVGDLTPLSQLEARLGFAVGFAREREDALDTDTRAVVKRLAQARAMTSLIRRGHTQA
ncbi:MAG: hypothetical protein ACRDM0_08645, partial [Thermoleophilaceae bacterium]